MSIAVICSACKASFQVSDKFAGKKGPCPKCKAVITVPAIAADEVKVHVPEEYAAGGKDVKGRSLTKPIPRPVSRFQPKMAAAIGGGTLAVLAAAWFGRGLLVDSSLLRAAGLLLISPTLAVAGYMFLRSDEDLEPHRGRWLWLRALICGVLYALYWGILALVPPDFVQDYWSWLYVAPPFLIAGAVTAISCLDLDFGSGFFHYAFYLAATIGLRFVIGMPALWEATTIPP